MPAWGRIVGWAGRNWSACLFAIWALPLLLTIAAVTPPWMNSDEPFQLLRAVQIAHGHLLAERLGPHAAGGLSNGGIEDAFAPIRPHVFEPDTSLSAALLARADAAKWHKAATASHWFANTAQYAPFFYVPDAAAYWAGRALGLHVDDTLRLARAANALTFLTLALVAIATARRSRPFLLATLMLPTTLGQAASASQDAIMLPLAALVAARIDLILSESRPARGTELGFLAAAIAMLAMGRPPYAALALLLLMPGRITIRPIAAAAAAVAASGAWCLLIALRVAVPMGASDPAAQLAALAANPASLATLLANTAGQIPTYASEIIGRLGWLDVPFPLWYRVFAAVVLALCALAACTGPSQRRYLPVAACALASAAIFTLQYFDWSGLAAPVVQGVVGRYFTPLLMVSALALPSFQAANAVCRHAAGACLIAFATLTPAMMLHHMALKYYAS